jgi:preprotein translocase subunit SecG
MQDTILIIYLAVAVALIGIILLQQGKGAEMGASFGAGGANTVFGAAGSGSALTKATTILAIVFFATALGISYLNSSPVKVVDAIFLDEKPKEKADLDAETPIDPTQKKVNTPKEKENEKQNISKKENLKKEEIKMDALKATPLKESALDDPSKKQQEVQDSDIIKGSKKTLSNDKE